jgi:hypothetical protein
MAPEERDEATRDHQAVLLQLQGDGGTDEDRHRRLQAAARQRPGLPVDRRGGREAAGCRGQLGDRLIDSFGGSFLS